MYIVRKQKIFFFKTALDLLNMQLLPLFWTKNARDRHCIVVRPMIHADTVKPGPFHGIRLS